MIYLDNAATTPICPAAKRAIIEHFDDYGNPSSSYEFARKSRLLIEDARETIAKCINAEPNEIYFTSGGSEANSLALNGRLVLTTDIEHHSVLKRNHITHIPFGNINKINIFLKNISHPGMKNYRVISTMMVNNEIGTILPINNIAEIAHIHKKLFHTDAVQAIGHIPVDVKEIKCDMMSASAHKFGGMKGTGFAFIKNGINVFPIITGGKQESGIRPGTENVLGIVAMAAALEDAVKNMEERNMYVKRLRDKLLDELLNIDGIKLNGPHDNRVVSNINVCIDGVNSQKMVTACDMFGIMISGGSACNEGSEKPSHVLKAIGLSNEDAKNSIRITLSHLNTEKEIDECCKLMPQIIKCLRNK